MLSKDTYCLETLIESTDRIIEYTSGYKSADEFNDDYRNFDATMMNFVVIGEMVEKLSEEFKNKHDHIEWMKIKGFRNIVAHDYFYRCRGGMANNKEQNSCFKVRYFAAT